MVHIPQAVVVEAQEAQGLLEAELLAEMVVILPSRIQRRVVPSVVVAEKVPMKPTQVAPQNMAEAAAVVDTAEIVTV